MTTGSLINLIQTSVVNKEMPEVGDGATVYFYTDRAAGTVISVTPKGFVVQEDFATRVDTRGMSDMQDYEYSRNPNGIIYKFRLNKRGQFKNTKTGLVATFGRRNKYHDYSF